MAQRHAAREAEAQGWNEPQGIGDLTQLTLAATEEDRETQRIKNQWTLADVLSKAQIFDSEADTYKAFAKIQIGAELGLQPAESMRAVFFGQSGPDIDIHTRVALAMRSGKYRYDILRLDQDGCEIAWYRKDNGQWFGLKSVTCTIDQLKAIDVWEKGKQGKLADKWNYKSWREDMLYAYVQRRCIRRYAIETQGSFAPSPAEEEELESAGVRPGEQKSPEEQAAIAEELAPTMWDAGEAPGSQEPRPDVTEESPEQVMRRAIDELARRIILPLDETVREPLWRAIAQHCFGQPSKAHLHGMGSEDRAAGYPLFSHLCARIESQGIPQDRDLDEWVQLEIQSQRTMRMMPKN